jgi:hypothetical protein
MCFSLTITTASPQWCGTWNVTKQLIIAGFAHYKGLSPRDYFNGQQKPFPPSLDTSDHYWYGPDSGGYYFAMRVGYGEVWYPGTYQWGATCTYTASLGEKVYSVYFNSSALICGSWYAVFWTGGITANMVTQAYSQFRGAGGMNPTAPATQDEANAWALNSDWSTIVKSHLDAVLRATQNPNDLNSVGVTVSDPNNSLDGQRW